MLSLLQTKLKDANFAKFLLICPWKIMILFWLVIFRHWSFLDDQLSSFTNFTNIDKALLTFHDYQYLSCKGDQGYVLEQFGRQFDYHCWSNAT